MERPPTLHRRAATGDAVVCRDLTKEFVAGETRVQALRGVDMAVSAGEMTLLVGPSGCGKTTLISVIAALLDPTAGEVEVLGTRLSDLSPREKVDFRRENIGFVFQQYNLLPSLTAAENVAVPLVIAGWKRRPAVDRAHELLKAVRLEDRALALPAQLSGGQQQRVAIARALVHEPRLLVCDEPTAALDAELGQSVMALIRQVAVSADRAVIVVTHDSRVFGFGDRIVSMNDGRVASVESRRDREGGKS
jgi:putative ABC transport system ATP-binding protein